MSNSIESTLAERGSNYGVFSEHARITQKIKSALVDTPNWELLRPDQKEAMEMVAHKFGRILNGNPDFHDSWHDCIGYLKLVADNLPPDKPKLVVSAAIQPTHDTATIKHPWID